MITLTSRLDVRLRYLAAVSMLPMALLAQDSLPSHRETIVHGYHEPSGFGNVELRPMKVVESPELGMTLMAVFPGRRMTAPPRWVSVGLRSRGTRPRFRENAVLSFVVDGAHVPAGAMFRVAQTRDTTVEETLALRIPLATFRKVAQAGTLTVRIDTMSFALTQEQLAAMRDFGGRLAPAGWARANAIADAVSRRQGFTLRKDWYERSEVDTPARPLQVGDDVGFPADALPQRRVVTFEYVIDTLGVPDLTTFRGTHPERDAPFLDVLRRALEQWRFAPAEKAGRPVRQMMRQAKTFEPSSAVSTPNR
jgi:hypothetical protein